MIAHRRQSNIVKGPLGQGLNWGHPLAANIVAAWLCNEGAGLNVHSQVNANDTLVMQPGVATISWANQPFGLAVNPINNNAGMKLTTPSAALKPANAVSVFFRGFITNTAPQGLSANPGVAVMSFTNTNTTPFGAYGIFRNATDATGLYFQDSAGGAANFAAVGSLLSSSNIVVSTGLTFRNGGNCTGYFNGRQVVSNARSGALTYGTPLFYNNIDQTAVGNANTSTDVIYVWNRELSAAEMLWLHTEPYAMLDWRTPTLRRYFGAPFAVAALTAFPDTQIPQLLAQ